MYSVAFVAEFRDRSEVVFFLRKMRRGSTRARLLRKLASFSTFEGDQHLRGSEQRNVQQCEHLGSALGGLD